MTSAARDAGICLSYDDWFVDEWFSARKLFRDFGARVTFFVARPDSLSAAQLSRLEALMADGHEIGFHTMTHPRLPRLLLRQSLESFLEDEIDRGIAFLRRIGFDPRAFAYPHHEFVHAADEPLLRRFSILRYRWDGPLLQERIYRKAANRIVNVMGSLDLTGTAVPREDTLAILDCIKERGGYGVLCGHSLGTTGPKGTLYCSLSDLEWLLDEASARGLRFATIRDLADNALSKDRCHGTNR